LYHKDSDTLNEDVVSTINLLCRSVFVDEKAKKKAMNKTALEIVEKASADFHPITFSLLTVKIFMMFLFEMGRKNKVGIGSILGKSGITKYRSALMDLYRDCEVCVCEEFERDLSIKVKGLIRTHATEKERLGGRLTEGKEPMSFALYKLLSNSFLINGSKDAVFARAFMTLTWNLMCRSINSVFIHRNHISWTGDCMTIQFAHMKSDKEGKESSRKRHIYANPINPAICCPTAIALYMMTHPQDTEGTLFNKRSYARFSKILAVTAENERAAIDRLGVDLDNIGVHSIRKGSATYACSGTTAAPNISFVCIPAGWTMGKVKDVYLQYAEAGDQHVGRVESGLPVLDIRFSSTTPFFKVDDGNLPAKGTCTVTGVDEIVKLVFPFTVPVSF
jgi:hypothetical protein